MRAQARAPILHFAGSQGCRACRGFKGGTVLVLLVHPVNSVEARTARATMARRHLGETFMGERLSTIKVPRTCNQRCTTLVEGRQPLRIRIGGVRQEPTGRR